MEDSSKVATDYASCVAASERNAWSLEAAVAELEFDPSLRFMPESLVDIAPLDFLSEDQRLKLNQIRGFSYTHLFWFVEEFIVDLTLDLAGHPRRRELMESRALVRFCEEELKHQQLFVAAKQAIEVRTGLQPEVLEGCRDVAMQVMQRSQLSVLIVTLLLEWVTQRHYLEVFRDNDGGIDPAFVKLFQLHWVEEANHTRIDGLEVARLASGLAPAERAKIMDEVAGVLRDLDQLLAQQTRLDLEHLQDCSGELIAGGDADAYFRIQHQSYRWTFIHSGLEHPQFRATLEEVGFEPESLDGVVEG